MNQIETLTPAALYARVSSDRQDVDLSVAAQLRALRDYAEKNGYIVAREYVDEAESGRSTDRPEFNTMIDAASRPDSPFKEILVWKFSRFTRKREHAVAYKSMLRKRGIKRNVSITEHADDSPTGKLMEAIIESVDEFYSRKSCRRGLARGMREAASRGFWMSAYAPYGYKRRSRSRTGPRSAPNWNWTRRPTAWCAASSRWPCMGTSTLDITKTLNGEGIASPKRGRWAKTTIHRILTTETYTGTVVWGTRARDNAPPVRVEDAFPAIVSRDEFERVAAILGSKAPSKIHPRRAASPYLLSGIVKCETCDKALTAHEAKSGQFTYYVCHSLLKQGQGACDTPRLNAKRFERMIIDNIRENILTESNIRELVKLVNEELDSVIKEQREKVEAIEEELSEIRRQDGPAVGGCGDHRPGNQRHPAPHPGAPGAAGEAGDGGRRSPDHPGHADARVGGRGDHRGLREGDERLPDGERVDRDAGLHPFIREGDRGGSRQSRHPVHHPHAPG